MVVFCCSSEGHKAYVIPAGGSSTLGAWGYIDAFDEMMQQVKLINGVHVVGACAYAACVAMSGESYWCGFGNNYSSGRWEGDREVAYSVDNNKSVILLE